jgi:hypothetical protein
MAVLVTAIHVFIFEEQKDVDARDKPAHDGVIPIHGGAEGG